ncbi:substrate-binding periplasmic protein [Salidesulfovibrio onnuriiensis]|uniref:substrate-binding periplasmic protein n=1 Tax=Salidesulfovibrio onnuriiensis TaxID=2583823 RepID=UPI0011C8B358|nr:transporter substrate-binding domain-containing protein [Salidesulfovibrio onnuriiensis]
MNRRDFIKSMAATGAAGLLAPLRAIAGPLLSVNYAEGAPPYSYAVDGTVHGLLPDSLDFLLGEKMGFGLRHRTFPWKRSQLLVRQDDGDALCTTPTPERRLYLDFSAEPVVRTKTYLFYSATNPRAEAIQGIRTLEDLGGFQVVNYLGDAWMYSILPAGLWVYRAKTVQEAFHLVGKNRQDVFIGSLPDVKGTLSRLRLAPPVTCHEIENPRTASFHLGIRKQYPEVRDILARFDALVRRERKSGALDAVIAGRPKDA